MKLKLILPLMILLLSACSSKKKNHHYSGYSDFNDDSSYYEESKGIEDGTYSADVDYYNPETGYSNSYILDVGVEDGRVVRIDFANSGYLGMCKK